MAEKGGHGRPRHCRDRVGRPLLQDAPLQQGTARRFSLLIPLLPAARALSHPVAAASPSQAVQWAMLVCEPIEEATDASIRELPDDLRTARASACWHLSRCYERGVGVEEKSAAQAERCVVVARSLHHPTGLLHRGRVVVSSHVW